MAALAMDRVTPHHPPFSFCGVDCFGPFYVKRGRSQEKRYGCIFTYLTIRAIHIEKLTTMDSDSFLNALIRFSARRGVPKRIRSDNGSNFIGGDKELCQSIAKWNQSHNLRQDLLLQGIEWI
jgi:transposase InsO family protein